jgi:hypothetical protein
MMSHPSERDAKLCGSYRSRQRFEGKTARTGWNQSLSYSNRRKVVGSKIGSEKKWKNMMMNGKR